MTAALALAIFLQPDSVKADIDLAVRLWKEFKMPIPARTALPKIDLSEKEKALIIYGMVDFRTSQDYVFFSGTRKSTNAINGYSKELWRADQPLPASVKSYSANVIDGNSRFPESAITSTAVQCACIGLEPIARQIVDLNKSQNQPYNSNIEPWTGAPINDSLSAHTAFLIYMGFLNAIIEGSMDRQEILRRLIALEKYHLLTKGPGAMFSGGKWDISDRISDLRATIIQPSAKGNPIQAAVNDLINETKFPSTSPYDNRFELIPRCKRILSFGMKAVPYLAAEVDKPRLTRAMNVSMGNGLTCIIPVRAIAVGLIRKLSTDELSERGIDKKEVILAWYKGKTSGKMGNYLLYSLIEPIWKANDYNTSGFKMMIRDYPKLLPAGIEKLRVAKVDAEWGYYDIASSKLTKNRKLKLLLQASRGSDFLSLKNTVGPLRQVEEKEADNLLTRFVRTTPSQLDSERVDISEYMLDTNSPAIWKEFRSKVKLASPEMRMLLLGSMNRPFDTEAKQPVPRAAILLLHEYFDETTIPPDWIGNEKYKKSFMWYDHAPTFGEVALESAARLKGLIGKGKPTPDQWRQFREKIEMDLRKP